MPAYNNYFPMSYQPMTYGYQQPQYQPIMPQPQYNVPTPTAMPTAAMNTPTGIIWVDRNEALSYPVAPNNAVALWDKNDAVIYLKQADGTGKPTIKVYDLVERIEKPSESVSNPEGKVTAYATKSDLEAVIGAIKGRDDVISNMREEIDKLNDTMYGVAGKRNTTAKKTKAEEVEE